MDAKLTWEPHIDVLKKRMSTRMDVDLGQRNTQVVRPVATYACPASLTAARTRRQELHTIENKILGRILGASWFVRNT